MQYGADCLLHIHRLVKDNAGGHLLRNVVEVLDELADTIHYRNRVGVSALLHDRNVCGSLAIDSHHVGLNLMRVLRLSYVVYRDPGVSFHFERNLAQLVHVVNQAVRVNKVIVGPHLHVACRQNQIRIVDRAHHVHQT